MAGAMHNPLEQFAIEPVVHLPLQYGYDISITNSTLGMLGAVLGVLLFFYLATRSRAMVPSRLQSLAELTYEFAQGFFNENTHHHGARYFSFIFTLFLFIMFMNLIGMIPYAFAATSHIVVTFAMGAAVFIGVTLIAILKKGPIGFLKSFIPPGLPVWIGPLLLVIEMVSYLVRPFSLAIRLAANMFAGHTLMAVAASFVIPMGVFGLIPELFLVALTGLEIFVCILQAYVFAMLSSMYLGEALSEHH